jgi:hypothetical protein
MSIELTEPVILALKERLDDELPATIAAINSAVDDGIELGQPSEVLDYIPPPSDQLSPPVIGVGEGPSRFEDDSGFSATGKHEILVVVYDQSSDQRALSRQLRRWKVAIVRIVLADRNLGGAAWGTGLIGTVPGPTLVDNAERPREWFSWTGIRLWAKRDEE